MPCPSLPSPPVPQVCAHRRVVPSTRAPQLWTIQPSVMTPSRTLRGHTASLSCVAAEGSLLATGAEDRTVRLWDSRDGTAVATLAERGALSACCICERALLTSCNGSQLIRVWDLRARKVIAQLPSTCGTVCALAMAPGQVLSGDEWGRLRVRQQPPFCAV